MGLDWNIRLNGKDIYSDKEVTSYNKDFACNGMKLSSYLDGTTAHMVADLGLCPFYPLWPAEMYPSFIPERNEICAQDMQIVAKLIAKRAECAEHLRIAAWLWTWAEQCNKDETITLNISY